MLRPDDAVLELLTGIVWHEEHGHVYVFPHGRDVNAPPPLVEALGCARDALLVKLFASVLSVNDDHGDGTGFLCASGLGEEGLTISHYDGNLPDEARRVSSISPHWRPHDFDMETVVPCPAVDDEEVAVLSQNTACYELIRAID